MRLLVTLLLLHHVAFSTLADNVAMCVEKYPYLDERVFLTRHEDIDIFKSSEKVREQAISRSLPVFQDALRYATAIGASHGDLASMNPEVSQCAWLKVAHVERAGLGHTLAAFGHYLQDAIENELTFYSSFYSPAHDICDLNGTAHYFGLHQVFYWARSPPSDAKVILVGSRQTHKGCNSETLKAAVAKYRASHTLQCSSGHVVFECENRYEGFQSRVSKSLHGWERPVRAAFRASRGVTPPPSSATPTAYPGAMGPLTWRHEILLPQPVREAKGAGHLVVTLHMRRGDILRSNKVDKEHRLVSFPVFVEVIKRLLVAINETYSDAVSVRGISVFLLCENSPDDAHIMEYSASNVHRLEPVNAVKEMAEMAGCSATNHCSVKVLHNATYLPAFSAMCHSDILITAASGFSHAAAALCEPPVTVGFPLSMDFMAIAGSVVAGGLRLWRHDQHQVQTPGLREAVKARLSYLRQSPPARLHDNSL